MKKRLKQYDSDSPHALKIYMTSGRKNPCMCGSNCFYREYDKNSGRMYGVCCVCGSDVYEVKKEYVTEELERGIWE